MKALTIDPNSGIKAASYREIRDELQRDFKEKFGQDMNLDPSSPDGMLIDIFAYAYNALAQNLQAVASGLNVATASGIFLDYLANISVGGRLEGETDEALVKRILTADRYGYATYSGMLTYLQKHVAPNVGLAVNEENRVGADGIPPYRFAVFVPDGNTKTNNEIAEAIWTCKPAGIKSYGTESGVYNGQTVYFNRVSSMSVWFKVTITEYTEEVLPEDYSARIRAAIIDWSKTEYTAGKDIILQRVVIPVYTVPGVLSVTVEAKTATGDEWSDAPRILVPGSKYASVQGVTVEAN